MNIPNTSQYDPVKRNIILKAQVELEEKARRDWLQKWGFLLDFDKFCVEEAAARGIPPEDYKRRTTKDKPKALDDVGWEVKANTAIPKTTTGFVGWRSTPEYSLERMGPLYISPLHTLPQDLPIRNILLG